MLTPALVLPWARRSLRRGVDLDAFVIAAGWETPRRHRVLDLSGDGLRLAAGTLLPIGEHVVVCFTPPGWWVHGELMVWARVARAEARGEHTEASLGLELLDLPDGARAELDRVLTGRPPRLPSRRPRARRELVWVDALADLEPRPEDVRLEPSPLAPLLTGGRRALPSRARQSPPSSCR